MRLNLRANLPFIALKLRYGGVATEVENVLVDTGSASTIISADVAATVGILPRAGDKLRRLRGIGGNELVFTRAVQRLELESAILEDFEIEIGAMDYGFDIAGILGMDALREARAILNLADLTQNFAGG